MQKSYNLYHVQLFMSGRQMRALEVDFLKYMSGNELREAYLQFFSEKKGHLRLPSFSLIPQDDPTLLLIGAGMAPLKPFFTGKMKPPRTRITTSQRCVRTGDIENVGRTARHQTYFEMLGNFSFGDYFKGEAIPWAWEFLTEVIELPKEKLWVTVYPDDDEAIEIWKMQPGFPEGNIVKLEDNFWEIGPGPCGPDSEIYIDLGEERGCGSPDCAVGCDCDRYLEIWNLVFTQYDRQEDGSYKPLAHKNIDTGCGLERLASVVQEKMTNFETDLLYPIIEYASKVSGVAYGANPETDVALKVIADHARSMAIMIMDGILPSNEGRGYVLRRILRRAVRHGRAIGIKDKFLDGAVDAVVNIYRGARDFEELVNKQDYIKKVISIEEDRFAATLSQGMELLEQEIASLQERSKDSLAGEVVFRLYDTYGFPWELTEEILHEKGLSLDKEGFDKAMEAQRTRARNARLENARVAVPDLSSIDVSKLYVNPDAKEANVVAIWKDGILVDGITDGSSAGIILTETPFYAEGGGQVGDEGVLLSELGHVRVSNVKKLPDGTVYHISYVEEGQLKVGDRVRIEVDMEKKLASARNHTATHLLQAALKKVVGAQVSQAGSAVTPERLRFDFTNFEPVTAEQLKDIEALVNAEILKGKDVEISHMSLEEAKKSGAMALFSEKYGDIVRVVNVPGFSKELCGGSHVKNVGQIGMFKIVSESGIASGVRRIEAITGGEALSYAEKKMALLSSAAALLKTTEDNVPVAIEKLHAEGKVMQQKLSEVTASQEKADVAELIKHAEKIGSISVIAGEIHAENMDTLREAADLALENLQDGVVILGARGDGKANLVVKASKAAIASGIHAGKIIKNIASAIGGGGGGRPNMAQAGGKKPENLDEAFEQARSVIKEQMR